MKAFNNNIDPIKIGKEAIVWIILIIAFLLPRANSLGQFVAIDEVNWLRRSASFYDALTKQNWSETYINNSPGVITTWVGALAFKIAAPSYRATQEYKKSNYTTFQNALVWKVGVQPLYVLAISRAIMILLLMAVYLCCFYYARRIFGIWPSFLGFMIISLDPFFIALTRMSHLDAPQAVFMFLSILAFLSFLYRGNRWFDLVISGGAGGLAFLSKLPGLFIIPVVGLVAIWDWLKSRIRNKVSLSIFADKSILKLFKPLLIWALTFIITYSAFWPSMWVQPAQTTAKVFGTSAKYSSTIIEEEKGEQEDETVTISNRTLTDYVRYPETFLWRTTPIVLLGLVLLLATMFMKKDINYDETFSSSVQGLLIFLALYTIGITLPSKSSEKYYAPAYLVLDLLAGIGWYYFVYYLTKKLRMNIKIYLQIGILVTILLIQSYWVFQSFPYYFTYYNPLLGGINRAAQIRFIGVGEGLDKAGLYLIQKPESSELNVMSWYGTGPLSYFFDGHVTPLYMSNSSWTPEFIQKLSEMDYLVIYTNQKFRNQPPELFALLSGIDPEYTVTINGAEYAWLYKVRDIPLPGS